ncbi:MAG: hypothetical protein KDD58_11390 [Bdellovibrionales bacterium]|nr:hypothetical protein [Bdellovibrionales bacterium]
MLKILYIFIFLTLNSNLVQAELDISNKETLNKSSYNWSILNSTKIDKLLYEDLLETITQVLDVQGDQIIFNHISLAKGLREQPIELVFRVTTTNSELETIKNLKLDAKKVKVYSNRVDSIWGDMFLVSVLTDKIMNITSNDTKTRDVAYVNLYMELGYIIFGQVLSHFTQSFDDFRFPSEELERKKQILIKTQFITYLQALFKKHWITTPMREEIKSKYLVENHLLNQLKAMDKKSTIISAAHRFNKQCGDSLSAD